MFFCELMSDSDYDVNGVRERKVEWGSIESKKYWKGIVEKL